MKDRNLKHSDNWETPVDFYSKLNNEFDFDFDPCPINFSEITEDKDGLIIDWGERNFVNPPYSRKLKEAFVKRAIEMKKRGRLSVLLIPVSTSTVLFHDFILPNADDIRFIKKRIKFKGFCSDGSPSTGAGMHDSMIVIFDGRR